MVFNHDFDKFPELTNSQLETLRFVSPHPQIEDDFEAFVEKVTDGDTVSVITSSREFSFPVRLLDIDAPELSEGGDEAKEYLRSRVEGKNVLIVIDRQQRVGKYGRLLGKVIEGGSDVGEDMLRLNLVSKFGEKDAYKPMPIEKIFNVEKVFAGGL